MTTTSAGPDAKGAPSVHSSPPPANDGRGLRCRYCDAEIESESDRIQKVIEDVCLEHQLSIRELQGGSRQAYLVAARRCVARRLRNDLGLHLKTIGFHLGGRHHSTIINLINDA